MRIIPEEIGKEGMEGKGKAQHTLNKYVHIWTIFIQNIHKDTICTQMIITLVTTAEITIRQLIKQNGMLENVIGTTITGADMTFLFVVTHQVNVSTLLITHHLRITDIQVLSTIIQMQIKMLGTIIRRQDMMSLDVSASVGQNTTNAQIIPIQYTLISMLTRDTQIKHITAIEEAIIRKSMKEATIQDAVVGQDMYMSEQKQVHLTI
jgi:hypothetical protein